MKYISTIGLLLYLGGFGLFIVTFFLSDFQLTRQDVNQLFSDSLKQSAFSTISEDLTSTNHTNIVPFVRELNKAVKATNNLIIEQFSITKKDIDDILEAFPDQNFQFNLSKAQNVFTNPATRELKQKLFFDYSSWMDDRTFEEKKDLKNQLLKTSEKINQDIPKQIGISAYDEKRIKLQLTRLALSGNVKEKPLLLLLSTYGAAILGAILFFLPGLRKPAGIKNNHIFQQSMTNKGWLGILTGSFLIVFYILLYFFPYYMINWVVMVDPISHLLNGGQAGEFFLYGFLYTLAIVVMGVRMIIKYRHSNYHIVRTASVIFFQLGFAFLIPEILVRLNKPYYDFKNIWPLNYSLFFPASIENLLENGSLGVFMLFWGIILIIIIVPVFTYLYGKRWYCSWVCGCGGLAETLGDPYRQLSDKSLRAWRIERWLIHGILIFAVIMTAGMIYTFITGSSRVLFLDTYKLSESYGFLIGAVFSGVVGTGFYPLMGNRVWCRFGCPLAAYLGVIQRFKSRFRITTNGGQCISCGNCSVYCEMGIDVRWYAQRGQNIIRSSCVGCGVCSSVCPRGVLKLENDHEKGRFGIPIQIGKNSTSIYQA